MIFQLQSKQFHPEVFLKAAEFLGLKPEECGVVEDAYEGIDAAVSGHMTAIAIGDAAGYDKADYKLSTFKDLLDIAKQAIPSIFFLFI